MATSVIAYFYGQRSGTIVGNEELRVDNEFMSHLLIYGVIDLLSHCTGAA